MTQPWRVTKRSATSRSMFGALRRFGWLSRSALSVRAAAQADAMLTAQSRRRVWLAAADASMRCSPQSATA